MPIWSGPAPGTTRHRPPTTPRARERERPRRARRAAPHAPFLGDNISPHTLPTLSLPDVEPDGVRVIGAESVRSGARAIEAESAGSSEPEPAIGATSRRTQPTAATSAAHMKPSPVRSVVSPAPPTSSTTHEPRSRARRPRSQRAPDGTSNMPGVFSASPRSTTHSPTTGPTPCCAPRAPTTRSPSVSGGSATPAPPTNTTSKLCDARCQLTGAAPSRTPKPTSPDLNNASTTSKRASLLPVLPSTRRAGGARDDATTSRSHTPPPTSTPPPPHSRPPATPVPRPPVGSTTNDTPSTPATRPCTGSPRRAPGSRQQSAISTSPSTSPAPIASPTPRPTVSRALARPRLAASHPRRTRRLVRPRRTTRSQQRPRRRRAHSQ
jgi:hypothetical protein